MTEETATNLLEKYPFITHLSRFKPLAFYDLETTGTVPTADKIVEICIIKMDRGVTTKLEYLVDPLTEIPKGASDVHGITNEVLVRAKAKPFKNMAKEVYEFLRGTVLLTFNGERFDIPLLICEFDRAGIQFKPADFEVLDVRNIYVKMNQRRLQDAFEQYVGRPMLEAHKASADVEATMSILEKQIEFHEEFQDYTLRNMIDFASYDADKNVKKGDEDNVYLDYSKNFYTKNGTVYYAFGKNKGLPSLSDRSYLKWIATALSDDKVNFKFLPDTRRIATNLLANGRP